MAGLGFIRGLADFRDLADMVFSHVFIAIIIKSQYNGGVWIDVFSCVYCNSQAIIAISSCVYCNFTCQNQGGTQKWTFSGFRGSRSCYSHVFIAISRVILQYPHVFIHFLPSFRCPSGAIGDPLGVYIVLLPCVC